MVSESFKIFDYLPQLPPEGLQQEGMLMAVCESGKVMAWVDGSCRVLKASSVLVLRPGHILNSCSVSKDFKGFFISVSEKRAHEMLPSLKYLSVTVTYENTPSIQVSTEEIKNLTTLYNQLREKLEREKNNVPYATESLRCLCELLFYDTLSLYASHLSVRPKGSRRQDLLEKFMELVELNFKKERRVEFYAKQLFLTPKHLSTVIKLTSGHTASELITLRVMEQARSMLRNSGLDIQEIADVLNFKTQSFFGKYFKAHCGLSPREFRNSIEAYG